MTLLPPEGKFCFAGSDMKYYCSRATVQRSQTIILLINDLSTLKRILDEKLISKAAELIILFFHWKKGITEQVRNEDAQGTGSWYQNKLSR